MTTTNVQTDAALADVSDRQLARRLGQALQAHAKAESAARPNRAKIAAAAALVAELRTEVGTRLIDGRWTAWEAFGVEATTAGERRANGEGTVYHDKRRDRWIAQLTVNGRRTTKVCMTKREADDELRAAIERAREGRDVRESKWTVESWLEHCLGETWPRAGLKAATLANHRAAVDRWWIPEVGSLRLAALQPEHVDDVIGKMLAQGASPNWVRIQCAPLVKALGQAVKRGHVTRNVASLATRPKIEPVREVKYLDPAEARALLAACPDAWLGDAIALSVLIGTRRGETLGLCWDRLDLDGPTPTVTIDRQLTTMSAAPVTGTKTGERGKRTFALSALEVALLRRRRARQAEERLAAGDAWNNEHGAVFTTPIGTPIAPRNFGHAVEKLTAAVLGRQLHPHALRHTAATSMGEAGISEDVRAHILGHTRGSMTAHYSHVLREQLVRAAEARAEFFSRTDDPEGAAVVGL